MLLGGMKGHANITSINLINQAQQGDILRVLVENGGRNVGGFKEHKVDYRKKKFLIFRAFSTSLLMESCLKIGTNVGLTLQSLQSTR